MPLARVLLAFLGVGAPGGVVALPPLVLVPGLTGSGLESRLTKVAMPHLICDSDTHGEWSPTWVRISQILPLAKDCLMKRLTLLYNEGDHTYSNAQGVELRPVDFGGVGGIDYLDPGVEATSEFSDMIQHMEKIGYKVGVNLHGAPYDWRLAGDAHSHRANGVGGFYADLKQLIEQTVQSNGHKAMIVSHSLGCPTMLFFFHRYVSEEWRAAHIEEWIAMAGPWMGAARQASSYMGGDTLGLPTWLIPHDYVKAVQVNASSGIWLSPNPGAWGKRPVISTPSRNYTAADIPALVAEIGQTAGGAQTLALFNKPELDLAPLQKVPTNVRMQHWHGSGVKTPERFVFDSEIRAGFNEAATQTFYSDGDGTVNLLSLKFIETWPDAGSVAVRDFPDVGHLGIVQSPQVLQALEQHILGVEAPIVV